MTKTLRDQLSKIESLSEGWDGHGSPRIDPKITLKAYSLACMIVGNAEPFASPMSDGGVILEWEDETRSYSLEVSPK